MATTYAFDVYGTLIDPHAITAVLRHHIADMAPRFSQIWRDKQLEYSFRRGLMGDYQDFSVVTRQALTYACMVLEITLPAHTVDELLDHYRTLAAFDDAAPALAALRTSGASMYAFSNGVPGDLESLLHHAALDTQLEGIVSVHDVGSFKPDPAVYHHFNAMTGSDPSNTWLVSSNPFDVIGAAACGWNTAWVRRSATSIFDPWDIEPTKVVASLTELAREPADGPFSPDQTLEGDPNDAA